MNIDRRLFQLLKEDGRPFIFSIISGVLAAAMLIAGVAPPEETTGAVPVTDVTVPEPLLLNVDQSVEVK